jgi:hypothetical protein
MTNASAFFGIIKADKQADGTLIVTGIATDDTLDVDQQVCDPDWLKAAMPEWFSWGNIREQHSNIAAGVATEYEAKGSQHIITARVVDPSSVKKVENGVLKGFSIGIRNPRVIKDEKAIGGRIVDGQIVEVSLVDRPANPTCVLTVAKTIDGQLKSVEGTDMNEDEVVEVAAEKVVPETIEAVEVVEEAPAEEVEKAMNEESTAAKEDDIDECADCGKAEADCKCDEGGFERKAVEESSQEVGEESSQEIGEESSREGGVAGVAGKSIEIIAEQLTRMEKSLTLLNETYAELLKNISTTEDIAKSVQEVTERLSVVEKSPTSSAPVRMAVAAKANTISPDVLKAKEYRAKAMATTDRKLADGYLALAAELETNL